MQLDPHVQRAVEEARRGASVAGHPTVTVYHLLDALLNNGTTRETLQQAGGSPERLKAVALEHLQHVVAPSAWERFGSALARRNGPIETSSFRRAVSVAVSHMRNAGKSEVGAVDVLVALFRLGDRELTDVMTAAGLSRLAILRYHCHGMPASMQRGMGVAPAASCDVVIFNDHYTEMALVHRILEKAFEMSAPQALRTTMRVHADGSAVIGPYAADVAVAKAQAATEMAERADAPLRLELRATSS